MTPEWVFSYFPTLLFSFFFFLHAKWSKYPWMSLWNCGTNRFRLVLFAFSLSTHSALCRPHRRAQVTGLLRAPPHCLLCRIILWSKFIVQEKDQLPTEQSGGPIKPKAGPERSGEESGPSQKPKPGTPGGCGRAEPPAVRYIYPWLGFAP